jgi:threonine synthase
MNFYSISNRSYRVSFSEATLMGQAPYRGLFFPEKIPRYSEPEIKQLLSYSREELAFRIMHPYVGNSIPEEILKKIIFETINFNIPLVELGRRIYALELFHGPTWAFKDIGARFMSRCLGYFSQGKKERVTVLVATSGDTGGAVANGFLGVEGVEVIILYPKGKVSPVQELQLTTCGQNITALCIEGSFDDCQFLVKEAFSDTDLQKKYLLTSANSINIARWLPQQLYYFFALQQWRDQVNWPVVAVPSGNFGNIGAGLLARKSGLPVQHFIAACNQNDAVSRFLSGEQYQPRPSVPTLSNAMDVGDPSNFIRLLEIFDNNEQSVRKEITGYSVNDAATLSTMQKIYQAYRYVADPHGAVAINALEQYLDEHPGEQGIFLATAHPVKFPDVIRRALGIDSALPDSAGELFGKQSVYIPLSADFPAFKSWLLNR